MKTNKTNDVSVNISTNHTVAQAAKSRIESLNKKWFNFKNKEGILLEENEVESHDKVIRPIGSCNGIGFYELSSLTDNLLIQIESESISVHTTYWDVYCCRTFMGAEIDYGIMKLVEDERGNCIGWGEVDLIKSAEYERELCTMNNFNRLGCSELKLLTIRITDEVEDIDYLDSDYMKSKFLNKLKLKYKSVWEDTIAKYSNPAHFDCTVMTINEIVDKVFNNEI